MLPIFAAISTAAEQCVPFNGIAAEVGLTTHEWGTLLRERPDEVRYAVKVGRLRARVTRCSAVLDLAAKGNVAAAKYYLKRYGGWR